jgi:RNA polymerase-interacting CarD/CdnL/TRCF family regulator
MKIHLRNVRREGSRHFRNKKREYLKEKINECELHSKSKNIRDLYRGMTEFKKSYQPKTNLVKDERGNLLTDPKKKFNQVEELLLLAIEYTGGRWY